MIFPAPQFNPSSYFPGGASSLISEHRLPFNPADVSASVNQQVAAPDFYGNLSAMPQNTGVAFNSAGRAYMAAAGAADTQRRNATTRAMTPLQAEGQNLSVLLNQEAARNAEASALAGLNQSRWQQMQQQMLQQRQLQDMQGQGAMDQAAGMLSPFLQMLMGG